MLPLALLFMLREMLPRHNISISLVVFCGFALSMLAGCGSARSVSGSGWKNASHGIKIRSLSQTPVRGRPLVILPVKVAVPQPRSRDDQEKLQEVSKKLPMEMHRALISHSLFTTAPSSAEAARLTITIDIFSGGSVALRNLVGAGAGYPCVGITGIISDAKGKGVVEFAGFRGYEFKAFAGFIGGQALLDGQVEDLASDIAEALSEHGIP